MVIIFKTFFVLFFSKKIITLPIPFSIYSILILVEKYI